MDLDKLSDLIMQVLVLVLPYFAVMAARWIDAKYKIVRTQLTQEQNYALDMVIDLSVKAAEQIYKDGNGEEKKAYVLGLVESYIAKSGIKIDADLLLAKIESEVFASFGHMEL